MGSLSTLHAADLDLLITDFGAKVVNHGRYVTFQIAGVAIPRDLFADILRMIMELRPPPLASVE